MMGLCSFAHRALVPSNNPLYTLFKAAMPYPLAPSFPGQQAQWRPPLPALFSLPRQNDCHPNPLCFPYHPLPKCPPISRTIDSFIKGLKEKTESVISKQNIKQSQPNGAKKHDLKKERKKMKKNGNVIRLGDCPLILTGS